MSVNLNQDQNPYSCTEYPISGTYDGVNTVFTLHYNPNKDSEELSNTAGARMHKGIDYTLSGKTLTMTVAPDPSDSLFIKYRTNG